MLDVMQYESAVVQSYRFKTSHIEPVCTLPTFNKTDKVTKPRIVGFGEHLQYYISIL